MLPLSEEGAFLVVDDPFVRGYICSFLGHHGYVAIQADVLHGLAVLAERKTPVRLLITNTPAKFAAAAGDIPLLYIASCPDPVQAASFRRWRALRKPFKPADLLKSLDQVLRDSSAAD